MACKLQKATKEIRQKSSQVFGLDGSELNAAADAQLKRSNGPRLSLAPGAEKWRKLTWKNGRWPS